MPVVLKVLLCGIGGFVFFVGLLLYGCHEDKVMAWSDRHEAWFGVLAVVLGCVGAFWALVNFANAHPWLA